MLAKAAGSNCRSAMPSITREAMTISAMMPLIAATMAMPLMAAGEAPVTRWKTRLNAVLAEASSSYGTEINAIQTTMM